MRDIHFRPITAADWHRLQLFHERLSEYTVELRFHGAKRSLSEPLAHRLTELDGHDQVGWVATTGSWGRIIGVARYIRFSPTSAEVAFVIADAFQHHGIGHRLMKRLVESARENNISEFVAEVLPGNFGMLHLLREAGPTTVLPDGGVWEVHVALEPT